MKIVRLLSIATMCAMLFASCKGNGEEKNGGKENPNPTKITAFSLIKADLAVDTDGFNMITDGGFERFIGDENWKSKSLFYLPEWDSEAPEAFQGSRTIKADCNSHDWRDIFIQSIAVKRGQDYTLSLKYRAAWKGCNFYMGFRADSGIMDQNTNDPNRNDAWDDGYTLTKNAGDNTQFNAFFGGWCWDNLWCEVDDVKVIPTGSSNDTFLPQNATVEKNEITNASFNEITGGKRIIAWIEPDGNIAAVINGASVDGKEVENVFVGSKDKNASDGVKVLTVGKNPVAAAPAVPTGGITINGVKFVHYYYYSGMSDGEDPDWICTGAGLASSEDGDTWNDTALEQGPDSKFIKSSYLLKDKFVYIFGSPAGDKPVKTYVARVAPENIANLAEYQYWDGSEWVKGNEDAAAIIFYGPTDDMSVVYNSSRYTFMALYRSRATGQLVYRDAGLPEGEWSGEKLLIADPDGKQYFAPQILSVSSDKIYFLASSRDAVE